jgi:ATP-dependent DNA helicase RecG
MSDEHQWVENVFSLWRRAERFLTDHLRVSAELPRDSWTRVDTPEVPPNALREALSNSWLSKDEWTSLA